MRHCRYLVVFILWLTSGCAAGLPLNTSVIYQAWPDDFQADYLWNGDGKPASLVSQPKLVRFCVRKGRAVRVMAFNFLGATLWDMTLQLSDAGKAGITYHTGSKQPLAKWMAKMVWQVFFSGPGWHGWYWLAEDRVELEGVLRELTFVRKQQQRRFTLHKVRVGFLADALFQNNQAEVQELNQ